MTASKSHTPSTYALEELNRESTYGGAGIEVSNRNIPVISLSDFDNRRDEITDQLWRAATEIGFFQLKDHGISKQMIQTAFHQAERFFNLDDQQKAKYPRPKGVNAGWESRSQVRPSTGTKDDKESYQITRYHMEGLWPTTKYWPTFRILPWHLKKSAGTLA